jgi:hypothetical protein
LNETDATAFGYADDDHAGFFCVRELMQRPGGGAVGEQAHGRLGVLRVPGRFPEHVLGDRTEKQFVSPSPRRSPTCW